MSDYIISQGLVWLNQSFVYTDIKVSDGLISEFGTDLDKKYQNIPVIDAKNKFVFPGFIDVHVHFREPGFSYKETIFSGSLAAAHGGYTTVCTMPNLNPVPDSAEHLQIQLDLIRQNAKIHVRPFASITIGECGTQLSDFSGMADKCAGFSDDGKGIQDENISRQSMKLARSLNKIISSHCEDNSLLNGGYIHDGEYARAHEHKGICSQSEWEPIKRDLRIAKETGCAFHVCHISAKESVSLIRDAKQQGIDVTCETGPHYLTLCDSDLQEDGRFKMNPPLRSSDDRKALIQGILDGTIDMVATDHAPHSAEEKSKGLQKSQMGIVGLETSFPVLYTKLVKTGIISLEKLIILLHDNPSKRFGIGSDIAVGAPADLTIFDLNTSYIIDPADFCSMGKSSPFVGWNVFGMCELTLVHGEIVWKKS